MANIRLTVQPLSRNDISIITSLLEQSFDYYLNLYSPFFSDYLRALRTVVGLGFAAVLADRSLLSIYQWYLNHFMQQNEGDFREAISAKTHIAQCTAEMVGTAVISFQALGHPLYYGDFLQALHYILTHITTLANQTKEAERILNGLSASP